MARKCKTDDAQAVKRSREKSELRNSDLPDEDAIPDVEAMEFEVSPVAWMNRAESAANMAEWVPFKTCPKTKKMLAGVNRVIEKWTNLKLKLEKEMP